EHVCERAVGDAAAVREAAAEPKGASGREAVPELPDERRLAESGLADHQREARLAGRRQLQQPFQLALAANERAREAVAAARPAWRHHPAQLARCHSARLALRLHGARLAELERLSDERGRTLADEDLARGRRLLEPSGDVHGIAGCKRTALAWPADD